MYVLTEEGKKYLEKGLPEKNLVKMVKKGKVKINDAKTEIENFSIALQWAKKNNWVMAVQGEIELIQDPVIYPEEDALKTVSESKPIDEKIASVLVKRGLIEKEREDMTKKAGKMVGKDVTHLTTELIKTRFWKQVKLKPYNVEAVGKKIYPGKRQPYQQFVSQMKKKLIELGFKEMVGSSIETEFWNFDALYQPQNHPARSWAATYQLKEPKYGSINVNIANLVGKDHEKGTPGSKGWGYKWDPKKAMQLMPRAHGTCLSARTLANKPNIPGKYFAIARCYRPDVLDATHLIEFNQAEGIVIDESLTLKSLLGILEMFAKEIAGAEKVKFLPDYYPFTEPSVQLSAKHPEMGWIEFGGSGIFREELTKPLGINTPVIAWGIGIDRLAMFKLGVEDVRYLFAQDLKWLRNTKMVI